MDSTRWGAKVCRTQVSLTVSELNINLIAKDLRVWIELILEGRIIPKKLVKDNVSAAMDEINVLKGLDHPNIVHVWDHFESRDK